MFKLPDGWEEKKLADVILDIGDGGTPSRSNEDYFGGEIPWVVVDDINPKIISTKHTLTDKGFKACTAKLWPSNSVIISTGATIGEIGINQVPLCTKQGITGIIPDTKHIITDYLYQLLHFKVKTILTLAQGSTIKEVRPPVLKKIPFALPEVHEQEEIAEILGSVDEAIEKTQAVIDQTARTKKALMRSLLTKGIPGKHKAFKTSPLGPIPENWDLKPLGSVLKVVERKIKMGDDEEYELVTVRRRNEGIISRGHYLGKHIKVKSQFKIKAGDFLISKRQIVHGACEIVPDELDGSIVSNEYSTLQIQGDFYLPYFRWLTRSRFMYRYFLISSVGVHIEKMLFKLDQWFKLKIPVPPYEEQVQINQTLISIEEAEQAYRSQLSQLKKTKTALMQVLLTGKVRVPSATAARTSTNNKEVVNG